MVDPKPSAGIEALRLRASALARIREFFRQRDVLEVDTPLLCSTTATDPHIESIRVSGLSQGDTRPLFLQTSPEFAMKKLLAAGTGSIYQLCKAFRNEERSPRHNPEFTLLEWYRTGFDEQQLMDEVEELVKLLTGCGHLERISYRQLFHRHLNLDPHATSDSDLLDTARGRLEFDATGYSRDDLLHLLLARVIEPAMETDGFVYDFPASMAALARVEPDDAGVPVARRFELFLSGMEIANGYLELTDATEQRRRFEHDLAQRRELGRDDLTVDEALLAALEAGLPDCAGVALGLDRLLMVMHGASSICEVSLSGLD